MPSLERKGMCSRCRLSERKPVMTRGSDVRRPLHCNRYGKACQQVARNCPGPVPKEKTNDD